MNAEQYLEERLDKIIEGYDYITTQGYRQYRISVVPKSKSKEERRILYDVIYYSLSDDFYNKYNAFIVIDII